MTMTTPILRPIARWPTSDARLVTNPRLTGGVRAAARGDDDPGAQLPSTSGSAASEREKVVGVVQGECDLHDDERGAEADPRVCEGDKLACVHAQRVGVGLVCDICMGPEG